MSWINFAPIADSTVTAPSGYLALYDSSTQGAFAYKNSSGTVTALFNGSFITALAQTITSGTALLSAISSPLTGNVRIVWNSTTTGVKNVPLPAPTGSGFEILILDFAGTANQGGNSIQVYGTTNSVLINGAQVNQATGLSTATIANAFGVIRLCDVSSTAWQIVGTV